jgi:hypothetical protein
MRGFVAGLALGAFIFPLAGFTHQGLSSSQAVRQDYIWLGTDLQLGVSEAEVRQSLAAKYDLRREVSVPGTGKGTWMVTEKGKPSEVLGVVTFKEEKLYFVTKRWLSRLEDQEAGVQTARAIYGILSEFVRQGETSCSIKTDHKETPSFSTQVASVACGQKHVDILVSSTPGNPDSVDINENLQ